MNDDAVEGMALPGGALECTCGEIIYKEDKARPDVSLVLEEVQGGLY